MAYYDGADPEVQAAIIRAATTACSARPDDKFDDSTVSEANKFLTALFADSYEHQPGDETHPDPDAYDQRDRT